MKNKISIIDYGLGNIKSIYDAFHLFHKNIEVTNNYNNIKSSDAIILPGVGSFAVAMRLIKKINLDESIKKFKETGKPIIGICLGMQLLFEESEEFGLNKGLSLIPGKVKKLKINSNQNLPNIGWREINLIKKKENIFEKIKNMNEFYFLHTFYCKPKNNKNIIAETNYGNFKFCSIVKKENIFGCQFHPEKSGNNGLQLINNFVNLIKTY